MKLLAGLFAISIFAQEPFQAEIDLRNRWVIGDRGQVYRSVVNLGEGVRVFGANLHYEGKDSIDARANGWGGDPNSDATVRVSRDKVYEAYFQYRTMAYFNNLPSFANPLFAQGALNSQRAMDVRRQQMDFDIKLKPKAKITPFFAVLRTNGDGAGVTPFVNVGDEFPVYTQFGDTLTTVRGGAQFTGTLWSATIELGHSSYNERQELTSSGNPGNRRTDDLVVNSLNEKYDASGGGIVTRALFQAQPFNSLGFSGHYVFSKPNLEANHTLNAQGKFRDQSTQNIYTTLQEQSLTNADQPRNSGSWTTEYRPFSKFRIRHTWLTDAYQISGASPTAAALAIADAARMRLNLHYDQSEAEASWDIGTALTLRGGHRWVRGQAELPPPDLIFSTTRLQSNMNRHVALAGASWRALKGRLRLTGDFEGSPGGETYFRTGLQEYRKLALQARIKLTQQLQLTLLRKTLYNTNVGIDFSNRQNAATLDWTPGRNRRINISATYSHEDIRSNATLLDPRTLQLTKSPYSDQGHHASAFAEMRLFASAFLQVGGGYSRSDGSRPTRYYSPQSKLTVPVFHRVHFVAEHRWYSYRSIESFRTHTLSAGMLFRWRQ